MDKNPQMATRVVAFVLFPFALALLVPAALLLGLFLYVGGALHALLPWLGFGRAGASRAPADTPRRPHFLEVSAARVRQESSERS